MLINCYDNIFKKWLGTKLSSELLKDNSTDKLGSDQIKADISVADGESR
jgi:hypothetical protein